LNNNDEVVDEVVARILRSRRPWSKHQDQQTSTEVMHAALATSFNRAIPDAANWLRAWVPRIVRLSSLRRAFAENHPAGQRYCPSCDAGLVPDPIGASLRCKHCRWHLVTQGYGLWAPTIVIRQGNTLCTIVPRENAEAFLHANPGSCAFEGLDEVMIQRGRQRASGHARVGLQRLVVTTGANAGDDLATLIHELAHLAAPNYEQHGPIFQTLLHDAIAELTGEKQVREETREKAREEARVAVIQRWLDAQKGWST